MRDSILLYVNGQRLELRGSDVFLPLSRFLRERLRLTGVKVVCGEGACGACSVLVGASYENYAGYDPARLSYKAMNSCLHPVFQMHGRHVVTVEGLQAAGEGLSPVQEAMVEKHGSQCGYCTPGIVMSLTGIFEENARKPLPLEPWRFQEELAGNLCRCTGYLPIVEAAGSIDPADYRALENLYPSGPIVADLTEAARDSVTISGDGIDGRSLLVAQTLELAVAYRAAKPGCRVVAGGTGFSGGERVSSFEGSILCLGRIPELLSLTPGPSLTPRPPLLQAKEGVREVSIGALATWTELASSVASALPELSSYLRLFGSPQISNAGTVGGSVAHAEGNADILPLLLVQEATVSLMSIAGTRRLAISDFLAQKCGPTELLTDVCLPVPQDGETLRLFKVRRRQAFDRSVYCAAITMRRRAEDGAIEEARIACGGIGPMPIRLPRTEAFLAGAPFTEETMRAAGTFAAAEISPVEDAYGSAEYRRQLAANVLLRYFWNVVESDRK